MKSAIILVGGEAKRAEGKEKYFFHYCGDHFIVHQINALKPVVDEILLVTKNESQCERFSHINEAKCIVDIRQKKGPIGGLHAGALSVSNDLMFVTACDMPCLNSDVVEYLFSLIEGYDAVIPKWNNDQIEPLHAVYRASALNSALQNDGRNKLADIISSINSLYVCVDKLRKFDPDLATFTNINRVEQLKEINIQESV